MGKFAKVLYWLTITVNPLMIVVYGLLIVNGLLNPWLGIGLIIGGIAVILSVIEIKNGFRFGFWLFCAIAVVMAAFNVVVGVDPVQIICGLIGIPVWYLALRAKGYWNEMT